MASEQSDDGDDKDEFVCYWWEATLSPDARQRYGQLLYDWPAAKEAALAQLKDFQQPEPLPTCDAAEIAENRADIEREIESGKLSKTYKRFLLIVAAAILLIVFGSVLMGV